MSRWDHLERGTLPEGAFVSDEDLSLVADHIWSVRTVSNGMTYVMTDIDCVPVYLHRLVLPDAAEIDHRNGNGLDNRRENLRQATHSQNEGNQRPQVGRSSRFKGVSWHKAAGKWEAYIQHKNQKRLLGLFASEEDAALAYNSAAIETWGEFARPNEV